MKSLEIHRLSYRINRKFGYTLWCGARLISDKDEAFKLLKKLSKNKST